MDTRTPELIFIHIPKCGGLSFLHTLQDVYGAENCQQVWDLLPYKLENHGDFTHLIDSPLYEDRAGFMQALHEAFSQPIKAKVLHGHLPLWAYDGYFPGVPRATWLRNPEQQVLSRIFHFRKHQILGAHLVAPELLITDVVFRNNQFWYTGGMVKQFSFVGTVENYTADLKRLASQMGWGDVVAYHDHRTGFEEELRTRCEEDELFMRCLRRANVHDFAQWDYVSGLTG